MKLELGAGHRPTRGYTHLDKHPFPHIEHVCDPWMLDLPDDSLDEVLAIAFIEHLTYYEALDTFRNVARMLKPGGLFLFDVPDYPAWARMYLDGYASANRDEEAWRIRRTLFGWGRWPGDEHKFGWDEYLLIDALRGMGFTVGLTSEPFKRRTYRERFTAENDPHIYVAATAP